jgi:hypothetical protein
MSNSRNNASGVITVKNRLINGNMRIDQRNAGSSITPTANIYTLDRWRANVTTASKYSVQQNAGAITGPAGFINYLGVTSLSTYPLLAGDYETIQQLIEADNILDFNWGSANAKAATLSFWVYSSLTGTFSGSIYFVGSTTRSYVFNYTITSANTWTFITIPIAGDTLANTPPTGNSLHSIVQFSLGVGSTYQTSTVGSWVSGNFAASTTATNILGTNGATFYLTGVQLEAGSVATPFERVDYGRQLIQCQRYYEKSFGVSVAPANGPDATSAFGIPTSVIGNNTDGTTVTFVVEKRTPPTIQQYGNNAGYWFSTTWNSINVATSISVKSFRMLQQETTGLARIIGHWTASAEL